MRWQYVIHLLQIPLEQHYVQAGGTELKWDFFWTSEIIPQRSEGIGELDSEAGFGFTIEDGLSTSHWVELREEY